MRWSLRPPWTKQAAKPSNFSSTKLMSKLWRTKFQRLWRKQSTEALILFLTWWTAWQVPRSEAARWTATPTTSWGTLVPQGSIWLGGTETHLQLKLEWVSTLPTLHHLHSSINALNISRPCKEELLDETRRTWTRAKAAQRLIGLPEAQITTGLETLVKKIEEAEEENLLHTGADDEQRRFHLEPMDALDLPLPETDLQGRQKRQALVAGAAVGAVAVLGTLGAYLNSEATRAMDMASRAQAQTGKIWGQVEVNAHAQIETVRALRSLRRLERLQNQDLQLDSRDAQARYHAYRVLRAFNSQTKGLEGLAAGRVTSDLLPTHLSTALWSSTVTKLKKDGLMPLHKSERGLYRSLSTWTINKRYLTVLIHLPVHRLDSINYRLMEIRPTPVEIDNKTLIKSASSKLLAVSPSLEKSCSLSSATLAQCLHQGPDYFCRMGPSQRQHGSRSSTRSQRLTSLFKDIASPGWEEARPGSLVTINATHVAAARDPNKSAVVTCPGEEPEMVPLENSITFAIEPGCSVTTETDQFHATNQIADIMETIQLPAPNFSLADWQFTKTNSERAEEATFMDENLDALYKKVKEYYEDTVKASDQNTWNESPRSNGWVTALTVLGYAVLILCIGYVARKAFDLISVLKWRREDARRRRDDQERIRRQIEEKRQREANRFGGETSSDSDSDSEGPRINFGVNRQAVHFRQKRWAKNPVRSEALDGCRKAGRDLLEYLKTRGSTPQEKKEKLEALEFLHCMMGKDMNVLEARLDPHDYNREEGSFKTSDSEPMRRCKTWRAKLLEDTDSNKAWRLRDERIDMMRLIFRETKREVNEIFNDKDTGDERFDELPFFDEQFFAPGGDGEEDEDSLQEANDRPPIRLRPKKKKRPEDLVLAKPPPTHFCGNCAKWAWHKPDNCPYPDKMKRALPTKHLDPKRAAPDVPESSQRREEELREQRELLEKQQHQERLEAARLETERARVQEAQERRLEPLQEVIYLN